MATLQRSALVIVRRIRDDVGVAKSRDRIGSREEGKMSWNRNSEVTESVSVCVCLWLQTCVPSVTAAEKKRDTASGCNTHISTLAQALGSLCCLSKKKSNLAFSSSASRRSARLMQAATRYAAPPFLLAAASKSRVVAQSSLPPAREEEHGHSLPSRSNQSQAS